MFSYAFLEATQAFIQLYQIKIYGYKADFFIPGFHKTINSIFNALKLSTRTCGIESPGK